MKPAGHQTITQEAIQSFAFPYYLRPWLANELPGAAVQADEYLFNDSYAHFMRASEGEGNTPAYENSLKWLRNLVLFATQQIWNLRRNYKIPAGSKGAWAHHGMTGFDSRAATGPKPGTGAAPVADAGWSSPMASAGDSSIARIQGLFDSMWISLHGYGADTFRISFAIGFALHAVQDSYTARHAERCNDYAGSIVRLYEWNLVRDATLIGLFPENPTLGALCNGEAAMSHYESDLLPNWTGAQRQAVIAATRDLIYYVVHAGDTAVDFADLKSQFNTGWIEFRDKYLVANLEPDRPTRMQVNPASAKQPDPESYHVAGGHRLY
jgi:hypothetical protein